MFYVHNKTNNEGFHEIKNEAGDVVATAANIHDQTTITLEVMGHADADVEVVYDQTAWDAIGR